MNILGYNFDLFDFTQPIAHLALIASVVLLIFWYRRPPNSPPGPRGIPLFGVSIYVGKYMERTLAKWKNTYGSIMSVRLGLRDILVLNDFESINQALVKQQATFSGRPHLKLLDEITKGGGIATLDYGDLWKSQRKFGLMTLRGFGVGKKSMESRVSEEVACLNEAIRSENCKAFDISNILHKAISNNICDVILGKRFDYDDKHFEEVMHQLLSPFEDQLMAFTILISKVAPWLAKIPPMSFLVSRIFSKLRFVHEFLQNIIDEHEQSYDKENMRDFIDTFLKEMKKGDNQDFSSHQLLEYIRQLFLAGTETTSSTLNWALLCLLHYPESQRKMRKEIIDVIGFEGTASMSHKSSMPYTCAFIHELMRYRTLAPLSVFHKTNEDTELNGYFIPKNTLVAPNIWAVHNDPEYWEEPETFKPERFINEKGEFVSSSHVIPFSVGPRFCLGEQLARMEIFLFLVSMVQKFEFLPDPEAKELPDIDDGVKGVGFIPHSFRLVAKQM
ncbi:cytochrome P450 2U1-like [Clavelina lepadiformis]|uniref:cytochrome P450 2U1-like n=1 Tax=Clavelina lepadiformis TaxID=159417 RepID=UPI004041BFB3